MPALAISSTRSTESNIFMLTDNNTAIVFFWILLFLVIAVLAAVILYVIFCRKQQIKNYVDKMKSLGKVGATKSSDDNKIVTFSATEPNNNDISVMPISIFFDETKNQQTAKAASYKNEFTRNKNNESSDSQLEDITKSFPKYFSLDDE